ncbi:hypothetical protein PSPO01_15682 [Paraphaeosphaeria sporulosa]
MPVTRQLETGQSLSTTSANSTRIPTLNPQ